MTPQQTEATKAAAKKLADHRYQLDCLTPQERALLTAEPQQDYTVTQEHSPGGPAHVLRFHGAYRGHWENEAEAWKAAENIALQKVPVPVKNMCQ